MEDTGSTVVVVVGLDYCLAVSDLWQVAAGVGLSHWSIQSHLLALGSCLF